MGAAGETAATPPVTSKAPKISSTIPTPASTTSPIPVASHDANSQAAASGYNEWLAAFQTYYQAGAQSPSAGFSHPYMWGAQPMMPSHYGGAHPSYGAMYPPGGMYGHPVYGQFGAQAPEAKQGVEQQGDGKREAKAEGSKLAPLKRSRGSKASLQLLKVCVSGGKENGVSQSVSIGEDGEHDGKDGEHDGEDGEHDVEDGEHDGETGSDGDGSTDASREENAQNLFGGKRSFGEMAIEAVSAAPSRPLPGAVPGVMTPPVGTPGPGGSLDMSLDYWSAGSIPLPKGGKRASGSPSTSAPPAELWLTDEREVKRQRRKQSNRESARRSRLRKQAECEELGTRVDTLTVENVALRTELSRLTEECKRLQNENCSLVQKIRSSSPSEMPASLVVADSAVPAPAAAEIEVVVPAKHTESHCQVNGYSTKLKEEKLPGERNKRTHL